MSSLVFRDRQEDFAGLGSFTARGHLTELTRGSGPTRDLPQTLDGGPSRARPRDAAKKWMTDGGAGYTTGLGGDLVLVGGHQSPP